MRPADDHERALHRQAEEARQRAYVPYSDFPVGAALESEEGAVVTAGNVENASYGLTICAERSAVVRAVAEGHRRFRAVAVAGVAASVPPCGACRQVLAEFALPGMTITFPEDGVLVTYTVEEILPASFRL
ncbi:MAG: Cytidine deaminase [uncultured Thermoleophilia bacterium]|uniref:Cytidine deaminase n=1 Tax=uncultured Thermoleophilia bacterium TaxID=1497501 RepID=A0A6J4TXR0_9ACTN|nr:MAG: Cytidine deaminase [uncultured Thermoleophilia bacterium]